MKCPKCDGRGKTTEYDGLRKFWCDYKCEYCNGTGEVEKILCDNCSPKIGCTNRFENKKTECDSYVPMNNEQFIRFCDTEQLAEWIVSEINERVKLALHDSELNDGDVDADFYMEDSDDWKEWLKQPHTKGDTK